MAYIGGVFPRLNEQTGRFIKLADDLKGNFISEEENFAEANLQQMKIRIYKGGILQKEVPILAKGDPENWGGSAAGVYQILSGNKASFSNIAEVYMPYALHYFGKYYIHGEPFYPGGEKVNSPVSGGCLSLENKDAEEVYNTVDLGMPLIVIDEGSDGFKPKIKNKYENITAESYLVADLNSGYVISEKNSEEKLPILNLMNLLEALTISENVNLEKGAVQLFYPLLMEHSEKAAQDLADFLGRSRTEKLMDEKAKAMLMKNTIIKENVSTAEDLFYLARNITYNRSLLWNIAKGEEARTFGGAPLDINSFENKNLFSNDSDFIGGETAYYKSGESGIFIFNIKDRKIAFIILDSKNLKEDIQNML